MDRLTKYSNETSHKNGVCCTHFLSDECRALGGECAHGCKWEEAAWERLAAYEDTGLTPQEVLSMKFEWCAMMDALNSIGGGYTRLRELAEADKDGRLVVRPCKVGDTLFRVFAGEILEHKVRNMRYLAIQERWDIDTTPFCSYVESSIGKTIFLTREEAKAALEAMKDGNG